MRVKNQSVVMDLHSRIWDACPVIDKIYSCHGQRAVITSAKDGKHMKGSKHYTGEALDLRTHFFTAEEQQLVLKDLQNELGSDFDIVLEKDHIHLEHDPKG